MLAPELYATEASAFSSIPGVVTITLASRRWDNSKTPGVPRRVVMARISMPTSGAHALATGLFDFLEKQGVSLATPEEKARPQ